MARTQPIQIPGETIQDAQGAPDEIQADEVADLKAQLARLQAQIAASNAAITQHAAPAAAPAGIYEPKTPRGAAALAASEFGHMTVAQLMAAIDAGQVREPFVSVLCSDGYYARRA